MMTSLRRRSSYGRFPKEEDFNDEDEHITTDYAKEVYQRRIIFEVAWEVVNKVGGIYTVIRTKAGVSVEELGDNYVLLGPLNEDCVRTEVDECELGSAALMSSVACMRQAGLRVVTGRWLIDGYPQVILLDVASAASYLAEWKTELWEKCHIGVPQNDREANEAVIFGALVCWLLGEFKAQSARRDSLPTPVVAHFHEWLAGVGLILLRLRKIDIATVFTTHATLLGRYLCAGQVDFYNNLEKFNLDKEAGDRNIYHRYCMERSAVHCAHVFTTVSEITAVEAQHLLKRRVDELTPNGLNVVKFAALHEFQNRHALAKEKINHFIQGHFSGSYDFDLDKTLYFFTAGRYEYTNKGADVFIEALSRLNHYLKAAKSDVTVVAFLIFPAKTNNYNVDSFGAQANVKSLRDTVAQVQHDMGRRLFELCLRGQVPTGADLLVQEDMVKLKRCIYSAKRNTLPPICTHNVVEEGGVADPVLTDLRRCQLFNHPDDRVKVVFHPQFLNSTNPMLSMDYEEFVRGCHLGVFPSYYEPWGYTPAECTVMGIPSVSTNLSGFGCFMQNIIEDPKSYGIYVVDRRYKSSEDSVQQLAQHMFDFSQMNRRQRIIMRNRTERLSELLDWKSLGVCYRRSRLKAMLRTFPKLLGTEQWKEAALAGSKLGKPYSEPASLNTSRNVSPVHSEPASDNEYDDVDEEAEIAELNSPSSATLA